MRPPCELASLPSAISACARFARPNLAPIRDASRSATMKPTLCRLPAYSLPGLPRPTTSHGASSLTDCPSGYTSGKAPVADAFPDHCHIPPAAGLLLGRALGGD